MDSKRRAAVIHALKGVFKEEDVPVGAYKIGGVRVVITLPDDAQVVRERGSEGDGFDAATKELVVPAAALAALLSKHPSVPKAVWKKAIRKAIVEDQKVDDFLPAEARAALKDLNREMVDELSALKKTAAKRLNIKSAVVEIHDAGQLGVVAA